MPTFISTLLMLSTIAHRQASRRKEGYPDPQATAHDNWQSGGPKQFQASHGREKKASSFCLPGPWPKARQERTSNTRKQNPIGLVRRKALLDAAQTPKTIYRDREPVRAEDLDKRRRWLPSVEDSNGRKCRDCPIYQLPNELLIAIVEYLDLEDLWALSATSRLFIELFSDQLFSHYWEPEENAKSWAGQDLVWKSLRAVQRVSFAKGQGFLKETARVLSDVLYCSGCHVVHECLGFSARQRDISVPETKRICIGHEGRLRLCSHKSVSWDDLMIPSAPTARGKLGKRQPVVQLTSEFRCLHPSHRHGVETSTPTSYSGIVSPSKTVSCFPTLTVFRGISAAKDRDPFVDMVRRSKMHMFDLDPDRPITMRDLERHLELRGHRSRKIVDSSDFEFRTPPSVLADEMRVLWSPFASSVPQAECLHRAKRDKSYAGWPLRPGAAHSSICRAKSRNTPHPWSREGTSVSLEVLQEARGPDGVLAYDRMTMVDPQSWGMNEDEDTRGMAWCNSRQCHTNSWY
ncbi:hypothetical protein B0T17DRAFT_512129 [Bombardia bombarda]|uniref:F-box domain-containing protein n=1 Tax=Bombardia bombarda TaxID=252184 RepID=A0AA39TH00_9PEZI|nr:hypothetical protein B0T17DRAFT_512129 [Bombardia bombarda]